MISQVKDTLRDSLLFYVRSVAAREAAQLLRDISEWLGRKESVDNNGRPIWSGFVGRLQDGRNAVDNLLKGIDANIAKIKASIHTQHATLIPLALVKNDEEQPVDSQQVREWAKDAFKDFGGSKTLFGKLQTQEGQEELLLKLRNKAVQQLPKNLPGVDPLMTALAALTPDEQREKFRLLLQRAMPWVPLNLNGDFDIHKDLYTCLIGVQNASEFSRTYGAQLAQCLPQGTGMTAGQIQFVESGMPGKLICYTELSGFPIPALTQLSTYLASYRKESAIIPLHVHKRISQFVQPIQFNQEQYRQFAEDFKLFLHAIALGILERLNNGLYEFLIAKDNFTIGDEFSIRQSGFHSIHRTDITAQVKEKSLRLDNAQVAALVELFEELSTSAYKAQKRTSEEGVSSNFEAFPFKIAELLKNEYMARLNRQAPADAKKLRALAEQYKGQWSRHIEGSLADVYKEEVDALHGEKLTVVKEFFNEGWLENLFNQASAAPPAGMAPPPPAAGNGAPPPFAAPQHCYHLSVSGTNYGPYNTQQLQQYVQSGQITRDSLLWREGMAAWLTAGQIMELAHLFAPAVGGPPLTAPAPPPAP